MLFASGSRWAHTTLIAGSRAVVSSAWHQASTQTSILNLGYSSRVRRTSRCFKHSHSPAQSMTSMHRWCKEWRQGNCKTNQWQWSMENQLTGSKPSYAHRARSHPTILTLLPQRLQQLDQQATQEAWSRRPGQSQVIALDGKHWP